MKKEQSWTSVVKEIFPGKFQLTVIDSSHYILWHRHCFTSLQRAENFSIHARYMVASYLWLCEYGDGLNWLYFEKYFILVPEELLYRHWAISITELVGIFYLKVHDPWGFQIDLDPLSMDDSSEEDALYKCRLYIDAVEFSRHPVPGQLSLFEVYV